jgi:hypothetical protein
MSSDKRSIRKYRKLESKRNHHWILLLTSLCAFLCLLLIPYYYSATNDIVLPLKKFDWYERSYYAAEGSASNSSTSGTTGVLLGGDSIHPENTDQDSTGGSRIDDVITISSITASSTLEEDDDDDNNFTGDKIVDDSRDMIRDEVTGGGAVEDKDDILVSSNSGSIGRGIGNSSVLDLVGKGEVHNKKAEENHFERSTYNDTAWVTNLTNAHKSGWIYEPGNVDYFWQKMGDSPFQAEFYSRLGNFSRIIDVGVRGYNRYCKTMINSTTTEYFQIEPFPPESSEMNNDGLLNCYMQEVTDKFPALKGSFDLVIDFGVFGWGNVVAGFGESGVREYIKSVVFLLKDKGCWALKTDKGWSDTYSPTPAEFFDKYILPYFDLGDEFNGFKSGHSLRRGNFIFYFFYKK